jgi:hypothetical protein
MATPAVIPEAQGPLVTLIIFFMGKVRVGFACNMPGFGGVLCFPCPFCTSVEPRTRFSLAITVRDMDTMVEPLVLHQQNSDAAFAAPINRSTARENEAISASRPEAPKRVSFAQLLGLSKPERCVLVCALLLRVVAEALGLLVPVVLGSLFSLLAENVCAVRIDPSAH